MMMPSSFARILVAVSVLALAAPACLYAQQAEPPAVAIAHAAQDSLLMRLERAQWEALKAGDTTAFARLMGGGVVDIDISGIKQTSRASAARYVLGCPTTSYDLSDLRVVHVGSTAIVAYRATVAANCWGQKAPSPLYVMTVYDQRGESWLPVAHSETPAARW